MNGLFGVGPLELVVIGVLALIFIGPERLPGVIRQVMKTIADLRSYADEVRAELAGEFSDIQDVLQDVTRDVNEVAGDINRSVNEIASETERAAQAAAAEVRPAVADLTAPLPPRDGTAPLPAPAGPHSNGVAHDDEESRPLFSDYRPQ